MKLPLLMSIVGVLIICAGTARAEPELTAPPSAPSTTTLPVDGSLGVVGAPPVPTANGLGAALPAAIAPTIDAPAAPDARDVTDAPAAPTVTNAPAVTAVTEEYYGRQILLVDGAAIGLILLSGLSESLGTVAVATAGFGGAVVHAAHGNPGRALGSVALRVSLVNVGALVGYMATPCDDLACLTGGLLGAVIGYGAAVAIDAKYLAHHTRKKAGPAYYPRVSANSSGLQVGVGGTF